MRTDDAYDFLIIGAGQAGIPLAHALAKAGKRTALAERKDLGGSCVNFGCPANRKASRRITPRSRFSDLGPLRRRRRALARRGPLQAQRSVDTVRTVLEPHKSNPGKDAEHEAKQQFMGSVA
jgi:glycine/D-amino acid oxidase-like deaminating enzyme